MSDTQKNNFLVAVGIITGLLTITGTTVQIGSLKGEIVSTIASHTKILDKHENKFDTLDQRFNNLDEKVIELKSHVHGVASQIGQLPGKVASRINENKP